MTRALEKAAPTEVAPQHNLMLFLLQYDLAGGDLGAEDLKKKLHIMIVFVFTLYVNMLKAITTTIFKTSSAGLTERYSVDYKLLSVNNVLKNIEGYRV